MAFKSEAKVLAAGATVIYRFGSDIESVAVQNPSSNSIVCYLGGVDVTVANGLELVVGGVLTISGRPGELLYAIPASGTPSLRVFEQGL